jgi:hypothetical protein
VPSAVKTMRASRHRGSKLIAVLKPGGHCCVGPKRSRTNRTCLPLINTTLVPEGKNILKHNLNRR